VNAYKDSDVSVLAKEISGKTKDTSEKAEKYYLLNAKFIKAYRLVSYPVIPRRTHP
jgi:hypothetical protein